MRQFFVVQELTIGEHYVFEPDQAHHIRDVLRMKDGDEVRLVTHSGKAFMSQLVFEKEKVTAIVSKESMQSDEREIICIASLLKREPWELLIQKACELGASRIVPLETRRTIIHLDDKEKKKKLQRWNKIALEACQQSNRTSICKVEEPIRLKDIDAWKRDVNLVAYESENDLLLRDAISEAGSVSFVIGPEGGFEASEIDFLTGRGFTAVSLGNRILRAETAAMFVLSVIEALK